MRLLRYPELKAKKGIAWSRVHLARLEKLGKFPRRIQLGANTIAWREDEIDAMIAAKAAERRAPGHATNDQWRSDDRNSDARPRGSGEQAGAGPRT